MIHQYDHRFGTYETQSNAQANQGKLPEFDEARPHRSDGECHATKVLDHRRRRGGEARHDAWDNNWLLGWRDITGTEKIRTVIACVIPTGGSESHVPS